MRNLTIPADVTAVIGHQRAAELTVGPYPGDYRCTYCHRRGRVDDGEALHAGIDVAPGHGRVWFAHVDCGPGGVKLMTADLPRIAESEATGLMYLGRYAGGRTRACLVLEVAMSVELVDERSVEDSGERVDQVLGVALARGMQPALDPLVPPEPDGPLCWRVQLPGRGRGGGVYGRQRLQMLEPLPPIPPGWLDVAAGNGGRCGLFVVSRIGLAVSTGGQELMDELARAARDGRLVGTTAAVVPTW